MRHLQKRLMHAATASVVGCGVGLTALALLAAPAKAATIDMEDIAPSNGAILQNPSLENFGAFSLSADEVSYWDSNHALVGTSRPDNGTDFLVQDNTGLLTLTNNNGDSFGIQSFDATGWDSGNFGGFEIDVSGFFTGGGSISTSFITDLLFTFETFSFSSAWTGLERVTFQQSEGRMAYDNIVVDVSPVPLPAALPLFGTGLGILGFLGWRRRRKAQAV